jgi:hypothetical protein
MWPTVWKITIYLDKKKESETRTLQNGAFVFTLAFTAANTAGPRQYSEKNKQDAINAGSCCGKRP